MSNLNVASQTLSSVWSVRKQLVLTAHNVRVTTNAYVCIYKKN